MKLHEMKYVEGARRQRNRVGRGRAYKYLTCTICSGNFMWNCSIDNWDSKDIFLCILDCFFNCIRNFVCLSGSKTNASFFITEAAYL